MIKIGLIKEGKKPNDRRVPLTPTQAQELMKQFSEVKVVAEASPIRCYTDTEYTDAGIEVVKEVSDCDILFGVKEVPIDQLIPGKTYFFFSHTIKKQAHNRKLLQAILDKKIRLIDYERLTDGDGNRLVAFGKWAGIVGAYNGIWTYGRRYNLFDLRRAKDCFDLEELKAEYKKVKLPPIKIIVTGSGRVAKGAIEVLDGMNIKRVSPEDFLTETYAEPVYTQLKSEHYHARRKDGGFDRNEFFTHPELYDTDFTKYTRVADLFIAAAFWNPSAPALFSIDQTKKEDFHIKIIADITCDIDGSIPTTKMASTIAEPIYDFSPADNEIRTPISDEKNITVMAIDNLPCELPRDASESFGRDLVQHVIPYLIGEDTRDIIKRATIAQDGHLTPAYQYLQDYVNVQG